MGSNASKTQKSEEDYQTYLSYLTHEKKLYSDSLQANIDLYRPDNPQFEEALILIFENTFEDKNAGEYDLNSYKEQIEIRKSMEWNNLTELVYVNFQVHSGICMEKIVCRIAFSYSEINLLDFIERNGHSNMQLNGNKIVDKLPNDIQGLNLLENVLNALLALKNTGLSHGFISPDNILVFNVESVRPFFKLMDTGLICKNQNSYQRMLADKDFKAPLDPDMLRDLREEDWTSVYDEHAEVWALGMLLLEFVSNVHFAEFYDWTNRVLKIEKLQKTLKDLEIAKFNKKLVFLLKGMLDLKAKNRISLNQIRLFLDKN